MVRKNRGGILRAICVFRLGLFLSLIFLCVPKFCQADDESAQVKLFLKTYLKQLNDKYPFSDWEKQLQQTKAKFDPLRFQDPNQKIKFSSQIYLTTTNLDKEIKALQKHGAEVDKLIQELYVTSITNRIDGLFNSAGKSWSKDGKLAFQRNLMQFEAGSIKPKSIFKTNLQNLSRDFTAFQTEVLFDFAQEFLGKRVEEHLQSYNFAKIEALYDDYSLQLDYWTTELKSNAAQSQTQLTALLKKYEDNKNWLRKNLDDLIEVLNTDMLFSDLLEYSGKQQVDFTIEVEDRIEKSLKESNQALLTPITQRILLWKSLAGNLRDKISEANRLTAYQKNQAVAHAEIEKKEAQRLETLRAEQHRVEEDQKAKFKQTLTALKTFSFKTETSVELDDDAKKALGTKAGFLKTSYVATGITRLKVDRSKFSDTLASVEKFSVPTGKLDFSKMSLQERTNQSEFTYTSPAGRTSQGDLTNFVSEVSMGSYSSDSPFLSYVAADKWSTGRGMNWKADRAINQVIQDRDFSYVDLVVDAHRKKSNSTNKSESMAHLPANMILIFDPQGSVIRFETFSDINGVTVESSDLMGGKLYYKFLNYTTDRTHIYLNGIDGELKVSAPFKK